MKFEDAYNIISMAISEVYNGEDAENNEIYDALDTLDKAVEYITAEERFLRVPETYYGTDKRLGEDYIFIRMEDIETLHPEGNCIEIKTKNGEGFTVEHGGWKIESLSEIINRIMSVEVRYQTMVSKDSIGGPEWKIKKAFILPGEDKNLDNTFKTRAEAYEAGKRYEERCNENNA